MSQFKLSGVLKSISLIALIEAASFLLRPEHKLKVYERSSGGRNKKDIAESRKQLLKINVK